MEIAGTATLGVAPRDRAGRAKLNNMNKAILIEENAVKTDRKSLKHLLHFTGIVA